MKTRFVAYITAAVLTGFAVMMLPLALETGPPTYAPQLLPRFTGTYPDGKETSDPRDQVDNAYGLNSQPSNLMPSSLILLAGLVFAFAAYIIVKKRVNQSSTFSLHKPF